MRSGAALFRLRDKTGHAGENPKSEIRSPKEIRKPKSETMPRAPFGFRISDLECWVLRHSPFVIFSFQFPSLTTARNFSISPS